MFFSSFVYANNDPYELEPFEPFDQEYTNNGGQQISQTQTPKPFHDDGFFIVPLYTNAYDGSSAIGITGAYYFRRYKEAPLSRPSYFRSSVLFGQNQYVDTNFIFDNYWNNEFSNLYSALYYRNRDAYFYGDYHESVTGLNLLYRQKYGELSYWGLIYNVEYTSITKNPLLSGARLSGLGIHIGNMPVDNIFAPRAGTFYELSNVFYLKYFGSENDFAEHIIDARDYNIYWKTQLLALQFYMNSLTGQNPPFTHLASVGKILRAYPSDLYVDRHVIAIRAEYRMLLFPKFVAVVFAGFGYYAATIHEFKLNDNLYSYGGGLRYLIYKPLDINARLDYAIGRGCRTLLLGIGEAF